MPALPLHEAGKYVAAAYVVVFALVLVYVAIMAARLGRIERELGELLELSERGDAPGASAAIGRPAGAATTNAGLDAHADTHAHTDADSDSDSDSDTPDSLDLGRPQSSTA